MVNSESAEYHKLVSNIDESVNFVTKSSVGYLESRYVRRVDDYFIVYLSSQSGCAQGCRMCHLTASNQRSYVDTTREQFVSQAKLVLDHYLSKLPAQKMHYNYMARGEPLDSQVLIASSYSIFAELNALASSYGPIEIKHVISTIMPSSFSDKSLCEIFSGDIKPEIYYSLYTLNEQARKTWLPNAMPVALALEKLKEWQDFTGKRSKIHYAFIKGVNDSQQDVADICYALKKHGLTVDFNVVRYNPFSDRYGEESDIAVIETNIDLIKSLMPDSCVQLVKKVGLDVKASCGMFVGGRQPK